MFESVDEIIINLSFSVVNLIVCYCVDLEHLCFVKLEQKSQIR